MLSLQVLWAIQHAGQAEMRDWFISRIGVNTYLTSRYVVNLSWTAAVLVLVSIGREESPVWYSADSRLPSIVIMNLSLWSLITLLFILGSPMGTNNKISHNRHDTPSNADADKLERDAGDEDYSAEQTLLVKQAPAATSTLSKITNQPQLLGIVTLPPCTVMRPCSSPDLCVQVLFITAMLLFQDVHRIHFFVWLPQLGLIAAGIVLQLGRMAKDSRYLSYLKETRVCPFHALLIGACTWTRQDSVNLLCGSLPALIVLAVAQVPFVAEYLSVFLLPSCLVARSYDCQVQALALEWVYIMVLVVAAELGARWKVYILPTGSAPVDGTKLFDFASFVPQVESKV